MSRTDRQIKYTMCKPTFTDFIKIDENLKVRNMKVKAFQSIDRYEKLNKIVTPVQVHDLKAKLKQL